MRVYLDLDGVMADFDAHFPALFGVDHREMLDDDMWATINAHPSYFLDMPLCDGAAPSEVRSSVDGAPRGLRAGAPGDEGVRTMTDTYKPDQDTFLRDVADHKMTGHVIDGVYRHITFGRPGSSVYRFHITTWPGYLCISGDMGSFVFSRLTDMFEFFRDKSINPCYWAEKIQATNKHGGHLKFSEDRLKEAVTNDFEQWAFDSDEQKAAAWKEIDDEWGGLFYEIEGSDHHHAVHEVMDWKCPVTGQRFEDFYEHNLEDFTYHYIWCCRAILWAIKQFDAGRAAVEAANDNEEVRVAA